MKSHFSTRYVLIVAALTLTVATALTLTGAASAQSAEVSANESTPEAVEGSVGPITIVDYELRDGTMRLTLDVDEPTPYALSDALAGTQSSGVTQIPVKQGAISAGRQTLRLDVTVLQGAGAVTLSTPNGAVRIQSGDVGLGDALIPASTVRVLLLGTAVGVGGFIFRTVRKKREDEDKEVERVL